VINNFVCGFSDRNLIKQARHDLGTIVPIRRSG
jgi:hypothetical protein